MQTGSRFLFISHWGQVTHMPGRHQAIIWTSVRIFLIRTLGTNIGEILSEIHTFSFKKIHLKISSAKWRPFSRLQLVNPYTIMDVTMHPRPNPSLLRFGKLVPGHWLIFASLCACVFFWPNFRDFTCAQCYAVRIFSSTQLRYARW